MHASACYFCTRDRYIKLCIISRISLSYLLYYFHHASSFHSPAWYPQPATLRSRLFPLWFRYRPVKFSHAALPWRRSLGLSPGHWVHHHVPPNVLRFQFSLFETHWIHWYFWCIHFFPDLFGVLSWWHVTGPFPASCSVVTPACERPLKWTSGVSLPANIATAASTNDIMQHSMVLHGCIFLLVSSIFGMSTLCVCLSVSNQSNRVVQFKVTSLRSLALEIGPKDLGPSICVYLNLRVPEISCKSSMFRWKLAIHPDAIHRQ